MCEIAILEPDEYSTKALKEISMELYESMRSSLGAVGVHQVDDKTKFGYDVFRDTDPNPEKLLEFVEAQQEKGAIRFIIHGRLATTGAVIDDHAHPLEMDCPVCNVDYVIHNGMVGAYRRAKNDLEEQGHEFTTGVDSEVIGHKVGGVPAGFDDPDEVDPEFETQPSFILMNDDNIFIHGSHGYHLSGDGRMKRTHRNFGPMYRDDNYNRVILTPEGAV